MIVYALPIEKDGEWYARVLVVDIESEKGHGEKCCRYLPLEYFWKGNQCTLI